MDHDIFISYRSVHRQFARRIRDWLTARGARVYLDDDMRLGALVVEELGRRIHASRSVLLLIGPGELGDFQQMEMRIAVTLALQEQKGILPVLLPGGTIPDRWVALEAYSRFAVHDDLSDNELNQLYQRIYGKAPPLPDATRPGSDTPGTKGGPSTVVKKLASLARNGPVTFYVGERASHDSTRDRPNSYLLSHRLFRAVELIDEHYEHFLPTYDVAGLFYATTEGGISELQDEVTRVLAEEMEGLPPTYERLAALLGILRRRGRMRSREAAPLMVVTTNVDLWMERALLSARVPFTRIVQMPRAKDVQWQVTEYTQDVLAELHLPQAPEAGGFEALDRCLDLAQPEYFNLAADRPQERDSERGFRLSAYTEPILYKYHGSQDVPKSCTISTDQFIDSATRSQIPEDIRNVISNTPALFLGYRLLDPPFRHLHRTLLRRAFQQALEDQDKVLVCSPPPEATGAYGRMEVKNWNISRGAAVKAGITAVEEWPADFVRDLLRQVGGAEP
jgi:hypothetical protein